MLPGNLNMQTWDQQLGVRPLQAATGRSVENVMNNNFGFGGNNCSLIFGW
jgi:3-oxoacyl-[acyl-carrier-protein] synthase-1